MTDDPTLSDRWVVISGCSGGGKSTLLLEFARRGYRTVDEPGRRIVKQEMDCGGQALPWIDGAAFALRAVSMALTDREAIGRSTCWVFFDRGVIDAAAALEWQTGRPALANLMDEHRYHRLVFLTPPWPEIRVTDEERRHGFGAAVREYEHLLEAYPTLGYEVIILPKVSVTERADFILATLPPLGPPPSQNVLRAPTSTFARRNRGPTFTAGAQTDDRHPGVHAPCDLDLEQGERGPLRQHQPAHRRSYP